MTAVNNKNQCFAIWSNDIEKRFDSFFYKPEFKELERKIVKSEYKRIKDIAFDLKNGSTPKGGIFKKDGIPYFRSQDFNLFDFKKRQFISKEFHKKLNRSVIKPKDVLVAVVGATLGVVGYVPENIKEGNINQNVVRIRVKDKNINPKYLAIILASEIGQKSILRNATIQTQAYLNNSQLGDIKIPIPPKEIQNRIVKIIESAYKEKEQKENQAEKLLGSVDNYVLEELGIKIPKLKNKHCFAVKSDETKNKRIDPKGYLEIPKTILKAIKKAEYKTTNLLNLIEKSISGQWGKDPHIYKDTKGYISVGVLRNTNFDNKNNLDFGKVANRLIEKDKFESIKLENNDILIEKSGGSPTQPVGRIAIIEDIKKDFTFSNFLQCIKIDSKKCLPKYLFAFLKTLYRLNYMEYIQNQTTGIKNLIMEEYFNIPIPLPSLNIQKNIAKDYKNNLDKAHDLISESKKIIEQAKEKIEKIILA